MAIIPLGEYPDFPTDPDLYSIVTLIEPKAGYTQGKAYAWVVGGCTTSAVGVGETTIPIDDKFADIIKADQIIKFADSTTSHTVVSVDAGANTMVITPGVEAPGYGASTPIRAWMEIPQYPVPDAYRPNKTVSRVRYAGRDFTTILDEIVAYLAQNFGTVFTDFVQSDLGIMFAELVAFCADGLAWYQDQQATECFLETAQGRNNIVRLARNVGYKVKSMVSASVDLQLTLGTTYEFDITVPARFQFLGPNGLIFELRANVVFLAGSTTPVTYPALNPAYEGQTINETFLSDGKPNQIFPLKLVPDGKTVLQGSFEVIIDGDVWTEVDFIEFTQSKIYEVEYGFDPPEIRFGDGIAGLIPTAGSEIKVKYIAGSGVRGNVGPNQITSLVTPLVIGGVVIDLQVNNPNAASGGSDQPSLEQIKNLAPRVFRSEGVAVTKEDFDALANNFSDISWGAVGKAIAVIVRDADSDVTLMALINQILNLNDNPPILKTEVRNNLYDYLDAIVSGQCKANHVVIYVLAKDVNGYYTAPTTGLLSALAAYLEPKKVVPVTIEVVSAWNIGVVSFHANIDVRLKISPNYVSADVKDKVLSNIEARFKDREFGENLRISDIYEDTDVDGVIYSHVIISQPPSEVPPNLITADGDMELQHEWQMIIPGTINIIEI